MSNSRPSERKLSQPSWPLLPSVLLTNRTGYSIFQYLSARELRGLQSVSKTYKASSEQEIKLRECMLFKGKSSKGSSLWIRISLGEDRRVIFEVRSESNKFIRLVIKDKGEHFVIDDQNEFAIKEIHVAKDLRLIVRYSDGKCESFPNIPLTETRDDKNAHVPDNKQAELIQAVSENRRRDVQCLLDKKVSPDTRDKDSVPLLVSIARSGNLGLLELFIRYGAHLECFGPDGLTPLLATTHAIRVPAKYRTNRGVLAYREEGFDAINLDQQPQFKERIEGKEAERRKEVVKFLVSESGYGYELRLVSEATEHYNKKALFVYEALGKLGYYLDMPPQKERGWIGIRDVITKEELKVDAIPSPLTADKLNEWKEKILAITLKRGHSKKPVNINARSATGQTVLHHLIAVDNNAALIEHLIKRDADGRLPTFWGDRPVDFPYEPRNAHPLFAQSIERDVKSYVDFYSYVSPTYFFHFKPGSWAVEKIYAWEAVVNTIKSKKVNNALGLAKNGTTCDFPGRGGQLADVPVPQCGEYAVSRIQGDLEKNVIGVTLKNEYRDDGAVHEVIHSTFSSLGLLFRQEGERAAESKKQEEKLPAEVKYVGHTRRPQSL